MAALEDSVCGMQVEESEAAGIGSRRDRLDEKKLDELEKK